MKLIIDSREKTRINGAKIFAEKNDIDYKVKQLKTGDYVFKTEDKTVAFEYKTVTDFLNSMVDGRVFRQADQIKNDYDYSFVLISGFAGLERQIKKFNKFHERNIFVDNVYNAIARLNTVVTAVVVLNEGNFRQDIRYMHSQALKCFENKEYNVLTDKKKGNNPVLTFLTCINGISTRKARLIIETYNIEGLVGLLGLTVARLTEIDGIGEKTAIKVIEAINNE